ncbi:MAG: hypothetical protein D6730_19300 [Bacteroidetes bacterium]|nr:MAG: hypothetical protein D6730_19300 [Bacteroidota bacterium]
MKKTMLSFTFLLCFCMSASYLRAQEEKPQQVADTTQSTVVSQPAQPVTPQPPKAVRDSAKTKSWLSIDLKNWVIEIRKGSGS